MMGCILRDFEYEAPDNTPPSVQSWPTGATPLNRVLSVDLSVNLGGDGGLPNEVPFEAEVRDANVGQALEGRVYLNNSLVRELRPIPAALDSADPGRRRVTFGISRTALSHGCHLVQLLVTSEGGFQPFPSREPREQGDIGSGSWWIAAYQTPDEPISMDECPEGL